MSSWLILAGVALNTAIPPLHAWLADAYPKATVTGAVFLSAFTTKSAVLILIKVYAAGKY
jgi:multicomponent Na+:H+ antiporter subunit D